MKIKKNKRILSLFTTILVLISALPFPMTVSAAPTMAGDGTSANPYQITTKEQLAEFRDKVNNGEKAIYGKLMNNIVLNENLSDKMNKGETLYEWTPIGNSSKRYLGTFDGNGHEIIGLYINTAGLNHQGLFGYTYKCTIKNLGVSGYINAKEYVGGIVGYNWLGTISNCYNTSKVSGKLSVGGVAGCSSSGTISNCYNTGKVSSDEYIGGIAGLNGGGSKIINCYNLGETSGKTFRVGGVAGCNLSGTISNCYNTGKVSGKNSIGGIAGFNNNSTINNCYNTGDVTGSFYVGSVSGNNDSTITNCYYLKGTADKGIGTSEDNGQANVLTLEQITGKNALSNMPGLDAANWYATEDKTVVEKVGNEQKVSKTKYFPHLAVFKGKTNPQSRETTFSQMQQDNDGLYLIYTKEQLETFRNIVNGTLTESEQSKGYTQNTSAKGKLMNDIVLNENLSDKLNEDGTVKTGESVYEWTPIGHPYQGTFDGDGHEIIGLYINGSGADNQGLFGYVKSGTIKNLGVTGYVKGHNSIGGIVGSNYGVITNCYYKGYVNGSISVGGVTGYTVGTITNCYNASDVGCYQEGGGIAGTNNAGKITNCYNIGSINNSINSGSIVGKSYGKGTVINNCYYLKGDRGIGKTGTYYGDGNTTKLTLAQMTGKNALSNMPGLDAANWYTPDDKLIGKAAENEQECILKKYFPHLAVFKGKTNPPETAVNQMQQDSDGFYLIYTKEQLETFRNIVNDTLTESEQSKGYAQNTSAKGKLMNDIVLNENLSDKLNEDGTVKTGETVYEWTSIGNSSKKYQGTFDGDGHEIIGLYINNSEFYQGLFGYVHNGTIKNLGITGHVKGLLNVGGVIGYSLSGTISNCYNTADVRGNNSIGGIAGVNERGTTSNCYNAGKVSGNEYLGGIVGLNDHGTTSNCYNVGNVIGKKSYIGSVSGYNYSNSTITNCYYLKGTADKGIGGGKEDGQATELTLEQMTGKNALSNMPGLDAASWYATEDKTVVEKVGNEQKVSETKYFPHLVAFKGKTNPQSMETTLTRMQQDSDGFYLIYTKEQLETFRNIVNDTLTESEQASGYTKNASAKGKLMNDIVLNENLSDKLNEDGTVKTGETVYEWTPIGSFSNNYKGTFDGDGHEIIGLYINAPSKDYQGLFGDVYNGTIKNLGVTGYVKANDHVSGLIGSIFQGTISNCYNAADVSGEYYVGGIAGQNRAIIINCYNTGDISFNMTGGGVVGINGGSIGVDSYVINCYNTGIITANSYGGGIVGYNNDTSTRITNCYYLKGTADKGINSDRNEGQATELTLEQMTGKNALSNMPGLDAENWYATEDKTVVEKVGNEQKVSETKYFPHLVVFKGKTDPPCVEKSVIQMQQDSDGFYLIYTKEQLVTFRNIVNNTLTESEQANGYTQNASAKGKLMNDIVLNENFSDKLNEDGTVKTGESVSEWTPIGDSNSYQGTFDGDGHEIIGLYINAPSKDIQGLFGHIMNGAIKNLGVTGYVNAHNYVGGIAGFNESGKISNCYNKCKVNGNQSIGGITGRSWSGTISNCYNTGEVSGYDEYCYIGGVAGYSGGISGTISNCYNTGTVRGAGKYDGGVVGYNSSSTISNCYNTGDVKGIGYVGGVTGIISGTISNCYNIGNVRGKDSNVGSVSGDQFNATITNCYYLKGTADKGIGVNEAYGQATEKTIAEFEDGTVLKALIGTQTEHPWDNECKNLVYKENMPVLQPVFAYQKLGKNEPQYVVVIPESVDVGTDFNITATSVSRLTQQQYIDVSVNIPQTGFKLQNDTVSNVTNTVFLYSGNNKATNNIAKFKNGSNLKSSALCFKPYGNPHAGKYSGNVTFTVSLKNES